MTEHSQSQPPLKGRGWVLRSGWRWEIVRPEVSAEALAAEVAGGETTKRACAIWSTAGEHTASWL